MSILTDRFRLARYLGKLFGGTRDLYKVFGYQDNLTYGHLYAKYHRQDITARVIDAPANALWDNPPKIEVEGYEGFEEAWNRIIKRLDIWQVLSRADKMAGMGEFAVILCGINDSTALKEPVFRGNNRELLYLQPYSADVTQIQKLVDDAQNMRYMLPELYQITPSKEINTGILRKAPVSFEAHADRMIHITESPLINNIYGNPRGVKIYNLLDDLLKIAGGTAETFWLTANRGMQIDVDKDMELTDDDAQDLSDEVEEYFHQLRRYIRTRGVDIKTLGSDVPNPKNVFDMIVALISGATGIPKRILIGSEAGQLASEQDRSNWAERIDERRTSFGNPVIMSTLLTLSKLGVLDEFEPEDITITWPDAFKLSPLERANTANQSARSAINLAKAMESPTQLMTVDEARNIIGLGPSAEVDLEELPPAEEDTTPEDNPEDVPEPTTEPEER